MNVVSEIVLLWLGAIASELIASVALLCLLIARLAGNFVGWAVT